jgi:hypothetical protein
MYVLIYSVVTVFYTFLNIILYLKIMLFCLQTTEIRSYVDFILF